MKFLKVYNTSNGQTRFGEVEVELRAGIDDKVSGTSRISPSETCKRFYFHELRPGYASGNDFASRRQVCVLLSGRLELRLIDGEKRMVGPGDLVRLHDTAYECPGRSMRVIGDEPARLLVLQLE